MRCSSHNSDAEAAVEEMAVETNKMAKAVDRFSRLTSDLANERTLLAWQRTCLAAIRTSFAFLAISANTSLWSTEHHLCTLGMTTVILVTAILGPLRHKVIKNILLEPDPPAEFGRHSLKWMNYMSLALRSSLCSAYILAPGKKR